MYYMDKNQEKLEGRALPVVLLTIFLDVLGIGILIPVMPQLIYKRSLCRPAIALIPA